MKKYLKTALVLALICAVAAVTLAYVNSLTAPKIKQIEEEKITSALSSVSLGYDIGEKQEVNGDGIIYYYELKKNSELKGYILGLSGSGYGGEFTMVGSYDTEGEILGAKMIANGETPGLGKKSEQSWYMDKFIGTGNTEEVPTSKNMLSDEDAVAVSGASITFGGVSKALKIGSQYIKNSGGLK